VGVTEYCPTPEKESIAALIGGTHQVDIEKIVSLKPDLILANQEENKRDDIEALERAGLKVWVTFPKTVGSALEILWAIARLFRIMKTAAPKVLLIERSLEWVQRGMGGSDSKRVFVPIWREHHPDLGVYWMTFNSETYCDSVLSTCGGLNIFQGRSRRYPLEAEFDAERALDADGRDTRYPRISVEEIINGDPEVILIPSEPFNFEEQHRKEMAELFADTPAVKKDKLIPVDGRWLSWHGTTLAKALAELPALLD
jgi:ABC-type Fe3+-hydroxamate transport system substrate-binding protein